MDDLILSATDILTYRELLHYLEEMSDHQLDCNISVEDPDINEYYEVILTTADKSNDVLDKNHPILQIVQ